ncbi:helix-turn-helix domain-containing protein [Natrinema sp. 1APR25-10V2]|uniref:helix-turn-helix domain-containing protein n=1 Tax=Natrinema sp. 1APR25-10V2 TaxID=2951081 RepID=UPI0028765E42|nr:helix-turn-helix domain-containing protein [Natrinema sp. 1APR25-10V2]MDS0475456.1 helix-turn-helix domain-containing protein [Natrinema sp. 1APR25-10V2]
MLLATLRLEHGALSLEETFERIPHLEVEAERIAAHSTEWTMPCMWATRAEQQRITEVFKEDPSVDDIVDATAFDDECFYQVEWSDDVETRIDAYLDTGGSILDAEATADGWQVRIRFGARDQFDTFRTVLTDWGYEFALLGLTEPNEPRHLGGQLTDAQREALTAANSYGYYEVPRAISTRELADELEMSHQNLSKLLRRATGRLIDETLTAAADTESE